MSNQRKSAYSVEVIGFNQTERIVLASIFGLSARRQPQFLQHSTVSYAPDLYLVDANEAQSVQLLCARNATGATPAILIGDDNHGLAYPLLARPLQWTKIFRAFDLAVLGLTSPPTSAPAVAAPAPAPTPSLAPEPDFFEKTQRLAVIAQAEPMPPVIPVETRVAKTLNPDLAPAVPALPLVAAAPLAPVASAAQRHAEPMVPPGQAPTDDAIKPDADWVLVVDDNATVREFMRTKLAAFNFNVDYAGSGEQAIGFTGQKNYVCVFLDVIMPGIDGYQVCKLIKSKKTATKTAVVMLTSKGSPFDKIRGAMAGCNAYLTKPVDEDKLLETIVRFLPEKK